MLNKYINTDVPGLVKDPINGAILNVDNNKLDAYKKQKQQIESQKQFNDRLQCVEKGLSEIKELLKEIIKR